MTRRIVEGGLGCVAMRTKLLYEALLVWRSDHDLHGIEGAEAEPKALRRAFASFKRLSKRAISLWISSTDA